MENTINKNAIDGNVWINDRNIIERNKGRTGCTMIRTANDIHETFTCDECEHRWKWDCVARKQTEFMNKKAPTHHF